MQSLVARSCKHDFPVVCRYPRPRKSSPTQVYGIVSVVVVGRYQAPGSGVSTPKSTSSSSVLRNSGLPSCVTGISNGPISSTFVVTTTRAVRGSEEVFSRLSRLQAIWMWLFAFSLSTLLASSQSGAAGFVFHFHVPFDIHRNHVHIVAGFVPYSRMVNPSSGTSPPL